MHNQCKNYSLKLISAPQPVGDPWMLTPQHPLRGPNPQDENQCTKIVQLPWQVPNSFKSFWFEYPSSTQKLLLLRTHLHPKPQCQHRVA